MARKDNGPKLKAMPINQIEHLDLVTADQMEEIRREVRAKIIAEQTKQAMDQLKVSMEAEERSLMEPEYEMVTITIDVPACHDGVRIDGVLHHHGNILTVPAHIAKSIRDIMQSAWFAEKLAGNPNMKNYLPPKSYDLSAKPYSGGGYGRT